MNNTTLLIQAIGTENITDILCKLYETSCVYRIYQDYPKKTSLLQKASLMLKEMSLFKKHLKANRYHTILLKVQAPDAFYFTIIPFIIKRMGYKTELIVFKYDIDSFRNYQKNRSLKAILENIILLINKMSEKYLLCNADKIIHKGTLDELTYLPFHNRLKDKPHHFFREFISEKDILPDHELLPKLSDKDKNIHLVYVGGLYFDNSFDTIGDMSYLQSFMKIVRPHPTLSHSFGTDKSVPYNTGEATITIHIYPTRYDYLGSKDYKNITQNYPQIIFHSRLKHHELIKEISQYDFGIVWFEHNKNIVHPMRVKTEYSNKIYDYICARLPTIYNVESFAIHEFFSANKLGIGFESINQINCETLISYLSTCQVIGKTPLTSVRAI
jgi:hypothetical protein